MLLTDKFFGCLGLCKKAGKLIIGAELSEQGIKEGKVVTCIVSHEISDGSKKKIIRFCEQYGVEYHIIEADRQQIGHALGKKQVAVVTICDNGFATIIKKHII